MPTACDIGSPNYWRTREKTFHIGDESIADRTKSFRYGNEDAGELDGRIKQEGYFRFHHDFGLDFSAMADLVRGLTADGLPPIFAFVYDEFWAPFHALDALYGNILGPYGMLPDFWVWDVDPAKGDAGWKPHRDKGHLALRPDGSPISLTTWLPLSDATPLNSCMYLVPADHDPTYGTPRDDEWRFELPSVRALPAVPGDVLVWNQAVLHWGSRGSWRETRTRVSIAFEFQARDTAPFNRPLLPSGRMVPVETRLALIGKQILQYRHMYRIDPAVERVAANLASNLMHLS